MCKIQLISSLLITTCFQCCFTYDPETVTIDGRTCYRAPVTIITNEHDKRLSFEILFNTTGWNIYRELIDSGSLNYLSNSVVPSSSQTPYMYNMPTTYYVTLEKPERETRVSRCDLKLAIAFVYDQTDTGIPLSEFARRPCVNVEPVSCLNEPSLAIKHNDIQYDPTSSVRNIKYSGDTSLECGGPLDEYVYILWYRWSYDKGTETISRGGSVHISESMDGAIIYCEQVATCLTYPDTDNCTLARSKFYTLQLVAEDACRPTPTKVRWGKACGGQLIFEDNFDSLDEDVWQVEQYARSERPEHAFCSRQRGAVSAAGGLLRVAPRPQRAGPDPGVLDLRGGCTAAAEACLARAQGAAVLPPVASGRLTSRGFAFKYGTVEVRARLPRGDWLYPELLLEPLMNRYGSWNEASGALRLAGARGNEVLYSGSADYSNGVLYGGPVVDSRCRDALMSRRELPAGAAWGERFHVFTLRWTPDELTLGADGAEWAHVVPQAGGLRALLPPPCDAPPAPGAPPPCDPQVAPFDQYFYVALGVAAGGVTEFPDGTLTAGGRPKPWRNQASKAMLDFSRDIDSWLPTWNQSELLVDYIRIRAL